MDCRKILVVGAESSSTGKEIAAMLAGRKIQESKIVLSVDDSIKPEIVKSFLYEGLPADDFDRQASIKEKIERTENKMNIRKSLEKTRLILKKFSRQLTQPIRYKR